MLPFAKILPPRTKINSCQRTIRRGVTDPWRESLGAIRSVLIDFGRSNALLLTACAKLFCAAFKPHCIDIATIFAARV
jgi:hypothetical protein